MGDPVVHFEIGSPDIARARRFYGELFDWVAQGDPSGPVVLVETGSGEGIGGNMMQTPEGVPPYVTFYVHVDDLVAYLDRVESLGGKVVVGPEPIPGVGSFAMFADPDGNVIGLFREGE